MKRRVGIINGRTFRILSINGLCTRRCAVISIIYIIVHVTVSYGLELSRYVPLILESVSREFIAGRILFPVARMRNLCGY